MTDHTRLLGPSRLSNLYALILKYPHVRPMDPECIWFRATTSASSSGGDDIPAAWEESQHPAASHMSRRKCYHLVDRSEPAAESIRSWPPRQHHFPQRLPFTGVPPHSHERHGSPPLSSRQPRWHSHLQRNTFIAVDGLSPPQPTRV
jgi:hypothetical protein